MTFNIFYLVYVVLSALSLYCAQLESANEVFDQEDQRGPALGWQGGTKDGVSNGNIILQFRLKPQMRGDLKLKVRGFDVEC